MNNGNNIYDRNRMPTPAEWGVFWLSVLSKEHRKSLPRWFLPADEQACLMALDMNDQEKVRQYMQRAKIEAKGGKPTEWLAGYAASVDRKNHIERLRERIASALRLPTSFSTEDVERMFQELKEFESGIGKQGDSDRQPDAGRGNEVHDGGHSVREHGAGGQSAVVRQKDQPEAGGNNVRGRDPVGAAG